MSEWTLKLSARRKKNLLEKRKKKGGGIQISGLKFNFSHLLKLSFADPDCGRMAMECKEIELSLRWSTMTLHAEVYEYDQKIKLVQGIITLIVASITIGAREHIQPTDCTKTAVSHPNCSSITSRMVIMHILILEFMSHSFNKQ